MLKRQTITIAALALGIAALGGTGVAVASADQGSGKSEAHEGNEDAREAQILAGARISLAQAVQVAESHTGMKAAEAEIDDEGGQAYFEVSIGQGDQEKSVLVDTQTGKVAKVVADSDEKEADED